VAALLVTSAYLWLRERRPAALVVSVLIPIVIWIGWQLFLRSWWGIAPVSAGIPPWSVPFVEFGRLLVASLSRRTHVQRLYLAECLFLIAIASLAVAAWRRSTVSAEWRVAWCGYLFLGSILHRHVWGEDFAFLRVLPEWFIASYLIVLASSPGLRTAALTVTLAMWLYLAYDLVVFLR
jgi:hypothetical protein